MTTLDDYENEGESHNSSEIEELESREAKTIKKLRSRARQSDFNGGDY